MNIGEQCNFLRKLYESKYYQQSTVKKNKMQAEELQKRLATYREKNLLISQSEHKQKSSPQFKIEIKKKIQMFQYCNEPLSFHTQDIRKKLKTNHKRKSKSVNVCKQNVKQKQQNWLQDIKKSILHSKQSHYLSALKQRRTKLDIQKTIQKSVNDGTSIQALNGIKPYRTQVNFLKNKISEGRKTFTILRNKSTPKTQKTYENHRRDDNDVLPWNAQIEETL